MGASPATVSRCAVIYMGAECLTWQQLIDAWLAAQNPTETQHLQALFGKVIPGLLHIVRTQSKPSIVTSDTARVSSTLSILSALMKEAQVAIGEPSKIHVTRIFCYAVMWGIGGCLNRSERNAFDRMLSVLYHLHSMLQIICVSSRRE